MGWVAGRYFPEMGGENEEKFPTPPKMKFPEMPDLGSLFPQPQPMKPPKEEPRFAMGGYGTLFYKGIERSDY